MDINQNPEQIARDKIDILLRDAEKLGYIPKYTETTLAQMMD